MREMDRLKLTLNIVPNDIGAKEVDVRRSLVVANLLAEIQDKFNLDGTLELQEEKGRPLEPSESLDRLGVADGATLVCDRVVEDTGTADAIASGVRESIEGQFKRVYLEEEHTLTEYDVTWQPAVVGRIDRRDPSKNRLLAVDLESIEDLPTVSRHHACITLKGGKFYIEPLSPRNPTYLDGKVLKMHRKVPMAAGARLQVGNVFLTFNVIG
jgi:FHA domain